MKPEIIADENISRTIIEVLRKNMYSVVSIKEQFPGLSDRQIIEIAGESDSLILTEDSDFGECIFRYRAKSKGILFLRYKYSERDRIIENLLSVLRKHGKALVDKFTVITVSKIRVRNI